MKKTVSITILILILGCASGCASFKGFGFGKSEPEFREVTLYEDGFRKEAALEHAPESMEIAHNDSSKSESAKKSDSWFSSGDSTFLMSSRAKEISERLDR